ncbi:hypothetical protein QLX08_000979 [Tetragonisca angustula]|uniref:Uncharacterized protein n=1 Tax=Tetragonisca angustula TaxID=166442 RepID=A0AAW1AL11_9HYME
MKIRVENLARRTDGDKISVLPRLAEEARPYQAATRGTLNSKKNNSDFVQDLDLRTLMPFSGFLRSSSREIEGLTGDRETVAGEIGGINAWKFFVLYSMTNRRCSISWIIGNSSCV